MTPYERAFADWLGMPHAFAFWKGRVAFYAILKALGVGEGDEVIIPGYTCVMVATPVIYLGATPIYVDIDPETYNLDPRLVNEKLTPKTKVILAQHTYGYPADLTALQSIAQSKGIQLVEDCCLALGGKLAGRTLGTFGTAAYFSFQWNKPYTSGLGGMAVTSEEVLAQRIQEICDEERVTPSLGETGMLAAQLTVYRTLLYPRTTAMAQTVFRSLGKAGLVVASSTEDEFDSKLPDGFVKGMSGVQQRSGARQLARIQRMIEHRKRMRLLYDELLADRGWPVKSWADHEDPVLVRYPVRIAEKWRALTEASKHLVELGSWFECPLHPKETNMPAYGYQPGMCLHAETASDQVVNLPLHPRANEATARRSVEYISRFGPAPCVPRTSVRADSSEPRTLVR